jgi:transposase
MVMIADGGRRVVGGVDCHRDTHYAFALDLQGRRLGALEVAAAATAGYEQLWTWLSSLGEVEGVGVEGTGSYGAGLCRFLHSLGVEVIEVNRPHSQLRSRRGKSDLIDAEGAARMVLAGETTVIPKDTTGMIEAIRQLRVVRRSAVKARSAALHQLGELIIAAPAGLRESLKRKTLRGQASVCLRLRPDQERLSDPTQAAKMAMRSLARRIVALEGEIAALDQELDALVASAAPRTTALLGVSTHHAAQLLVTAGQNIGRLRSEAAFARLCGAGPIPASSGQTNRHRLNPGGDRGANRSLHLIVVVRLRHCDRTRAYAQRRRAEGKSTKEIIRCLKRYVARQIYHTLGADLADLAT